MIVEDWTSMWRAALRKEPFEVRGVVVERAASDPSTQWVPWGYRPTTKGAMVDCYSILYYNDLTAA